MKLPAGLYETLITKDFVATLAALGELIPEIGALTDETAPQALAQHLQRLIEKALRSVPGDDKLPAQLALANRLVELLAGANWQAGVDDLDGAASPGHMLLSVREPATNRLGTGICRALNLP